MEIVIISAIVAGMGALAFGFWYVVRHHDAFELRLEIAMLRGQLQEQEKESAETISVLRDVVLRVEASIPEDFHTYASLPVRVRLLNNALQKSKIPPVLHQQPMPEGSGELVWPAVIEAAEFVFGARDNYEAFAAILQQRDLQGQKSYGVPLRTNNGRDALVDALQEALDLAAYLAQASRESGSGPTEDLCLDSLQICWDLFEATLEE